MPHLTARLLGSARLSLDGRPVEISSSKARALLFHLVATRQVHSRDRLAGFFWPDVPERNALASLRTALYDIRRAMGPGHEAYLFVDRARLGFDPDGDLTLDLQAIEALGPDVCDAGLTTVEAAVAAYGGAFLQDVSLADSYDFDDWVFLERERYEHMYVSALCRLADMSADAGRVDRAVDAARRVLAVDPLREDVHRQLMLLLARSGRRAEALAQYKACADLLKAELDIEPLQATRTLYRQIEASEDPASMAGVGGGASAPVFGVAAPAMARAARQRALTAPPENPLDGVESTRRIVGREREVQAVREAWGRAVRGHGGLLLLSGDAGAGKTRLLAEATRGAVADDGLALVGRCHESAASQPYGPLADALRSALRRVDLEALELPGVWLRELARLVPELQSGLPPGANAPLDGVAERDRLFDAVRAFIGATASRQPVLLAIDDLQWSDETSLSLLAYLARSAAAVPVLLLLTCRMQDLTSERRRLVRTLLAVGERVPLHPLTDRETADLVAELAGAKTAPLAFGERLRSRTGGNPFFTIETLRVLFDQGTLQAEDGVWTTTSGLGEDVYRDLPVPASVGLLIDSRLDRLSDDERTLLETAAVMRRDFAFDLVQTATGVDPAAALDALDRVLRLGLLQEMESGQSDAVRYAFTHALVRERLYENLSGARRQYLHRQIAGCLEARPSPEAERIAYHYLRGGVRDRACLWSLRAGERSMALYAAEDAVAHYQSALELAVGEAETHAALAGVGDALVLLGRPGEAVASFEQALEVTRVAEPRADLFRRIGRAHERQGTFDKALDAYAEARTALEDAGGSLASVRAADGLATVYVRLGRPNEAIVLGLDALRVADTLPEGSDRDAAEAWVRNTLGMALVHAGEHEEAIPHLERSLALKRVLDDALGEATLLNNLGVVHYRLGDDEKARDYYAASLQIKEEIGDGYGRAIALTNLALMETHLGGHDQAAEHLGAARDAAGDVNATWLIPEIHRVSAQRHLALGDDEDALHDAEESLAAAEELGVPSFIGVAHRVLGLVKARSDQDVDAAEEHFLTSLAVFEMQADEHELAKTRAAYAELLLARGRSADAEAQLDAAADVFRRSGARGRLDRLQRRPRPSRPSQPSER